MACIRKRGESSLVFESSTFAPLLCSHYIVRVGVLRLFGHGRDSDVEMDREFGRGGVGGGRGIWERKEGRCRENKGEIERFNVLQYRYRDRYGGGV